MFFSSVCDVARDCLLIIFPCCQREVHLEAKMRSSLAFGIVRLVVIAFTRSAQAQDDYAECAEWDQETYKGKVSVEVKKLLGS